MQQDAADPSTSAQTLLEYRSKLWNTAELGSLLLRQLSADSKKQHDAIYNIRPSSRLPYQIGAATPRWIPATECDDEVRHRISSDRAPLSG